MNEKQKRVLADAFGIDASEVNEDHETVITRAAIEYERAGLSGTPPGGYGPNDRSIDTVRNASNSRVEVTGPVFDFRSKHFMTEPPKAIAREAGQAADIERLQKFNDDALFLGAILGVNPRQTKFWHRWCDANGALGREINEAKGYFTVDEYDKRLDSPSESKATLTTTTGADYIPTILSSNFIETMREELTVAPLLMQISMASRVVDVPGEGATEGVVYAPSETQSITSGDLDDRKISLTAKRLALRSTYTDEVEEDSIVPILELHQRRHARRLADAIEAQIVHGDTDSRTGVPLGCEA